MLSSRHFSSRPSLGTTLLVCLLTGTMSLFAQPAAKSAIDAGLRLADSVPQILEFQEDAANDHLYTVIQTLDGSNWTVELSRHSVRSASFQVLVDLGSGALVPVPAPALCTWRGSVIEEPELQVFATFAAGKLRAKIFGDHQGWAVQPVEDAGVNGQPGEHVFFSDEDVQGGSGACGTSPRAWESRCDTGFRWRGGETSTGTP